MKRAALFALLAVCICMMVAPVGCVALAIKAGILTPKVTQ